MWPVQARGREEGRGRRGGATGRPGRRAPSHSDPAEQHKACPSGSPAKGAVSARPGGVVVVGPGRRPHRPSPRKAGEQGSRAEAEGEARQAAGRKPRERTHSPAGAKLGLRDPTRPGHFLQAWACSVASLGLRLLPRQHHPRDLMWRMDFSTRQRQ